MNVRNIVNHIVNCEAKASQVKIGDVREIVSIVSDLIVGYPEVIAVLIQNGLKRKKKQGTKKRKQK